LKTENKKAEWYRFTRQTLRRLSMRSFVLILVLSSVVLSLSNLQANGTESSAFNEPHKTKEQSQPNKSQSSKPQSPLIDKEAESKYSPNKATDTQRIKDEQTATLRHAELLEAQNIAAKASIVQAIALFITIVVMIWTTIRQLRAYLSAQPNWVFTEPTIK
jgi:hypothetical protein